MTKYRIAFVALALTLGAACSENQSTQGDEHVVQLILRTGEGCQEGCPIDRHMMLVGTEERIEIESQRDMRGWTVSTSDPSVAVAWYENQTLCCTGDALGTCRVKGVAEEGCASQAREGRMLAFRALTPGEVQVTFHDAQGAAVDRAHFVVGEAASVRARPQVMVVPRLAETPTSPLPQMEFTEPRLARYLIDQLRVNGSVTTEQVFTALAITAPEGVDLSGQEPITLVDDLLVVGRPLPGLTVPEEEIRVRLDTVMAYRLEARDSSDNHLIASRGLGARVANPQVATLNGGQTYVDEPWVVITPQEVGTTELTLVAGDVTHTMRLVVGRACAPQQAALSLSQDSCESDADCAPAGCCHATACGAVANAPVCSGDCTAECRPGTLDCGGRCLCVEGRCGAYLAQGVDPTCPGGVIPPEPETIAGRVETAAERAIEAHLDGVPGGTELSGPDHPIDRNVPGEPQGDPPEPNE